MRSLAEAVGSLCVTLEAHFSLDGAAGPTGCSGADRGVDRPELLQVDQDSRKNTEKTTAKTRARKTWKLSFPVVDDKII